jgi:hypothetical protein
VSLLNCGRCHACGEGLSAEDWCRACRAFRRYWSHGWNPRDGEPSACEDAPAPAGLQRR